MQYIIGIVLLFLLMSFVLHHIGLIVTILILSVGIIYAYKKRKRLKIKNFINEYTNTAIENFQVSGILDPDLNIEQVMSTSISEDYKIPKEKHLPLNEKANFFESRIRKLKDLNLPTSYDSPYNLAQSDFESFHRDLDWYLGETLDQKLKDKFHFDMVQINEIDAQINEFSSYMLAVKDWYEKQFHITRNGIVGEDRVNNELSMFNDHWINLSNIRLEINGESVETDNIVISEQGVFSIEVKNFSESGSYSIRIAKDGQWLKVFGDGNVKPMDKDVTSQVNRHIAYKQKFLNEQLKLKYGDQAPNVPIKPIIVIANNNVMLENQSIIPIMRVSQIYHYIQSETHCLDKKYFHEIKDIFEAHNKKSKSYPVYDYDQLEETYRILNQKAEIIVALRQILDDFKKLIGSNKLLDEERERIHQKKIKLI